MKKNSRNAKYLTIEDGVDFRTISKVMTDLGFKMNHATARNKASTAIEKLLGSILEDVKTSKTNTVDVEVLLKDKNVYSALGEILYAAFHREISKE